LDRVRDTESIAPHQRQTQPSRQTQEYPVNAGIGVDGHRPVSFGEDCVLKRGLDRESGELSSNINVRRRMFLPPRG
jgi:hypothetical protein